MDKQLITYLNSRIEDRLNAVKTSNPTDAQWLQLIAQELDWAKQVHEKSYTKNCVVSRYEKEE